MAAIHSHAVGHSHGGAGTRLRTAFCLTLLILVVEVVGGLISHSLALLSDAGHVLTDILALGLAWFAAMRAERPADARNTYGYHRSGILAALANAVTLIVVVGAIAYEAIQRLQHPQNVTPWIMLVAAGVAIAVNLYIALDLRAEKGENLNVEGVLLHALGDIGASLGVILGGVIILLTGWQYADPLISLAIAALVARSAWTLLGKAVDILMEATPKDLNVAQLVQDVRGIPGITDVHDLHIWSIAGGQNFLSAHVQVSDDRPLTRCDTLLTDIHCLLCERYHVSHTTIQVEHDGCGDFDLYCTLPDAPHQHAHPAESIPSVSSAGACGEQQEFPQTPSR
ncbi:MAG: cation diffusion facilitator family transporter [Ktedonobacterales bacterium]